MAKSDFGKRLKKIFGNATNKEIAALLGVSPPAVQNYVDGRVPPHETLLKIASVTNCDLHWLLVGRESPAKERIVEKTVFDPIISREALTDLIREVVRSEMAVKVQYIGVVDEFDVAASIQKHDNALLVLRDWYVFDGIADAPNVGDMAFSGWEDMNLIEKVEAVRAAKGIIDRQRKRKNYVSPKQS